MARGWLIVGWVWMAAAVWLTHAAAPVRWTLAQRPQKSTGIQRYPRMAKISSKHVHAVTEEQRIIPDIAVYNNETHLLVKLHREGVEHCAAFRSRPLKQMTDSDAADGDAASITPDLNEVLARPLHPSLFSSGAPPQFYGVFGVVSTSDGNFLGLISKVNKRWVDYNATS